MNHVSEHARTGRLLVATLLATLLVLAGCAPKTKIDVSSQVQDLKSGDNAKVANACIELAKAKQAAAPAVDALIPLLQNPDPETRRLAAYALGEIGAPAAKAVPDLKRLLDDPDRRIVMQAVNSLRDVDPNSVPKGNLPNVMNP